MTSGALDPARIRTATLERIVSVLRAWAPARIIFFGSHARGDARPDGDLDILVVVRDLRAATRSTVVDMRVAIGASQSTTIS